MKNCVLLVMMMIKLCPVKLQQLKESVRTRKQTKTHRKLCETRARDGKITFS